MRSDIRRVVPLLLWSALGCSDAESEGAEEAPAAPTTPATLAASPGTAPVAPGTGPVEPTTGPVEPGSSIPPLLGFAAAPGHGLETTTGGAGGETVTVTTFAELVVAVGDDAPRTVLVAGTITDNSVEMIDVGSNKSIIGTADGATIDGFGLDINGWGADEIATFGTDTCAPEHVGQFSPTSNVIVQNLRFINAVDDSINIQCYSHHIWIDHNTFENANDGSLDIKRGSDLITVSWNHFDTTEKTMLLGHSEDNGEQDRGTLRASYHHNWFDNTATRTPRVRFGYAHVWNNRVLSSDYFLGLGVEAHVYAEGNYVEGAKTLTQIFTESVDYDLTWTDTNHFDELTITRAQDMQKTRADWLDENGAVAPPTEYQYPLEDAATIADSVPAGAGVGKL